MSPGQPSGSPKPKGDAEPAGGRVLRSVKWQSKPAGVPAQLLEPLSFLGLRIDDARLWGDIEPQIYRIGVGYLERKNFDEIDVLRKQIAAATKSIEKAADAVSSAASDLKSLRGLARDYALGYESLVPRGPQRNKRGKSPAMQGEAHASLVSRLFGPFFQAYADRHAAWADAQPVIKDEARLQEALRL